MEKLTNLFKQPISIIARLKSILSRVNSKILHCIGRLNLAQKLYLVAILMITFTFSDVEWGFVCTLVLIGIGLEFWPRFTLMWHSLLGKSCLLFFYAIIANFSLASAASTINDITGVGAQHLPYSHNFAILLYLPIWLIGFTFLALLIIQLLSPFYITAILLLKPFGLRAVKTITQSNFPVLTTIARMGLSLAVLSQLVLYNEDDFMSFSQKLNQSIKPFVKALSSNNSGQLAPEIAIVSNNNTENRQQEPQDNHRTQPSLSDGVAQLTAPDELNEVKVHRTPYYQRFVMHSLNVFIYALEADSSSRCKMAEGVRVVEINDYEMLEITADSREEFGYHYEVKACQSMGVLSIKSNSLH